MKIMVIDGNSMLNRAFYGVRPLTTRAGLHTNAIYGFLSIYLKLLADETPDGVCVTFDLRAPTFRHRAYDGYKAQRKPMPDELAEQVPYLKRVLDAMHVMRLECEGYEADDIIGTISRICAESGDRCDIVTGDRDSFQLIANPGTNVLLVSTRAGKTETVRFDRDAVMQKYGLSPEKMIDLKALMGDASDNIPGVRGVGEKTAVDLVQRFGSINAIYRDLDTLDVRDALRAKLAAGRDDAFLSRELATICLTAPITFSPEAAARAKADRDALRQILEELEFKHFIARLGLDQAEDAAPRAAECSVTRVQNGLSDLIETLAAQELCAVSMSDGLSGVGLAFADQTLAVLRADFPEEEFSAFFAALCSARVKKACHDGKRYQVALLREGLPFDGFVFDTALGAYLLDPTEKSFSLRDVSEAYAPQCVADEATLHDEQAFSPLTGAEEGVRALGLAARSVLTMTPGMREELAARGETQLYFDIELPLCSVLADMQHVGMRVDRAALLNFGAMLQTHIEQLEAEIYRLAGEEFNILSPKQLGEVLFERLGLPPVKKTKTGYSTGAEVLEKLRPQHEIIKSNIKNRKDTKLKSTYCDGLSKVISPEDGRIHSSFNQMVTATGRISSTEPNLQNIPVRTELGGEVRRMFIPRDGWVFVDADYSQIELRILAHIADDLAMQRAFTDQVDIHTTTASQVFRVSESAVTPEMRRAAKAVNFGIVYGISEFSLAKDIGVSVGEARQYIENYLSHYAGVRAYMKEIVERARRDGYVTTLLGRRRPIPEIHAKNFNLRSFGERVALNAPIQGTAADIIKIAMLRVSDRLAREGLAAQLVLQVHDELIVEAPREEAEAVATILTEEMSGAYPLSVPLVAEAAIGENWYAAKK